MRLFSEMWLTKALDPDRKKLLRRGKRGVYPEGAYVVAVSPKPEEVLEILPVSILSQKRYKDSEQMIIAMAPTWDEALELSGGIIGRVYKETGSCNVAAYIRAAEKEL